MKKFINSGIENLEQANVVLNCKGKCNYKWYAFP